MDWKKIRQEYEQSTITLKELAAKHGVSEGTMRSRKNREKWQRNATENATQREKQRATKKESVATPKEISWVEIENEYVTDVRKNPCTLKGLGQKYGISHEYIRQHAARNDWSEKRNNHRTTVSQKTAAKAVEYISTDAAKAIAKHYRISDKIIDAMEKALTDEQELYTYVEKLRTGYGPGEFNEKIVTEVLETINDTKLLNIVSALEKLQKMQRQTVGVIDEKDKAKLKIDQDKFDLEKKKNFEDPEETKDDGFLEAMKADVSNIWDSDQDG